MKEIGGIKILVYTKGNYKYQVHETFNWHVEIYPEENISIPGYINLTPTGLLTIYKGYAWDGPSGPTIDTKSFMRSALVHDALYQLMRYGLLNPTWRKQADVEMMKLCEKDKMWKVRRWWVYYSVRKAAGFAAAPKNRKKVCYAPRRKK